MAEPWPPPKSRRRGHRGRELGVAFIAKPFTLNELALKLQPIIQDITEAGKPSAGGP